MSSPYITKPVLDRRTGEPVNMQAFGGFTRAGSPKYSEKEKMFNDAGVINASNPADALRMIQHILSQVGSGEIQPVPAIPERAVPPEEVVARIKEAMLDESGVGMKILGQEILNPIREVIDYEGFSRKVLLPRPVGPGEVVRYDKDPYIVAWVIAEDGITPESRAGGAYVYPPEFEVTSRPTIELRHIYQAQFDILSRIMDRARQGIEQQEDENLVKLLRSAANVVNTTQGFSALTVNALENLRYEVERHRLIVEKFLIHRREITDIVALAQLGYVDPVTQRELIMAGYIGYVLNAMIITTAGVGTNEFKVLEPGEVFAVCGGDHLGGMPVRVELFNEPIVGFHEGKPVRGWFFYELVGQIIINSKAVARGVKI
jgi:hypothetical protein